MKMDLATLVELKKRLDAAREERRLLSAQASETLERARRAIELNRLAVEAARRHREQVQATLQAVSGTAPTEPAAGPDQTCMFSMYET